MGRPPLAEDSQLYAFRLPASVMAQVDRLARRRDITRSEALRALLLSALAAEGRERKKR